MTTDAATTRYFPRADPVEEGLDASAVVRMLDAAESVGAGIHSLMVLRHGRVLAEGWWAPYAPETVHAMFSVSKSFTSTAVGLAQAEGRLSIDEPLIDFFPEVARADLSADSARLTLRHLLVMGTGHEADTLDQLRAHPFEDWPTLFFGAPLAYEPGTHFVYNSGASYMLAAAVTRRVGEGLLDYLTPRLFEPLGMRTPSWAYAPDGSVLGATGMRLPTEDLAKLGQLYLQNGAWEGTQLLDPAWVAEATSKQIDNHDEAADWHQGYGFQFWMSQHGYRADGAFGQFALVLPELDAVVAITAGAQDNSLLPPLVWDHLVPGFTGASDTNEQPIDAAAGNATGRDGTSVDAHQAMTDRLDALEVPAPGFTESGLRLEHPLWGTSVEPGPRSMAISAISFELSDTPNSARITFHSADGSAEIVEAAVDSWLPGATRFWGELGDDQPHSRTGSRIGWVGDVLELHQQLTETPFRRVWRFRLDSAGQTSRRDAGLDTATVNIDVALDLPYWGGAPESIRASFR